MRSELFFKAGTILIKIPTKILIIITKANMLPAANSTLYYEQAAEQLQILIQHHIFNIPIRLIGLFEQQDTATTIISTVYREKRYSRTVHSRTSSRCQLISGRSYTSPCKINLIQ